MIVTVLPWCVHCRDGGIKLATDSPTCDEVGDIYLFTASRRRYNAAALAIVSCPIRRECWILATPNFDYRAAQDKSALIPQSGQRYSSHYRELIGTIDVVTPADSGALEIPDSVEADIRLSWSPVRVSVCFLRNEVRRKISFRPHRHRPAAWKEVEYRHSNFDANARMAFPRLFNIPPKFRKKSPSRSRRRRAILAKLTIGFQCLGRRSQQVAAMARWRLGPIFG